MNDVTSPHDPLCPTTGGVSPCQCELIRQVRQDQHTQTSNSFTAIMQMPATFFEQMYREQQ